MRNTRFLRIAPVMLGCIVATLAGCSSTAFSVPSIGMPQLPSLPKFGKAKADADAQQPPPVQLASYEADSPGQAEKTKRGVARCGVRWTRWRAPCPTTLLGGKRNQAKAREHFAAAESAFRFAIGLQDKQREEAFTRAAKQYEQAASKTTDPVMHEDALFQMGESYFFANNYPKATSAYGGLLKKFPTSRYVDRVDHRRFVIADYWLKVNEQDGAWDVMPNISNKRRPVADTFGYAIKQLDGIRYDNPTGKLADDATMAGALAHYEAGRYGKADDLFTDLRDNFPSSEHQFRAHLLGLKCKLAKYAGPDYDGSILDESEELVKTMLRIFPRESESHRQYLEESFKDIRLKKAEREFSIAQYYDGRKEFGSARIYYQRVKDSFADTNLALEAESRLAQLEGEPDTPDQPLQWLSNAFPDVEDKPLLKR